VRVRLRKAWTPRVGQTVEVLVVLNPLFLVTKYGRKNKGDGEDNVRIKE
jgi:hypothetical protein